jgi:1,4-alpha-glucan branching enzyme
MPLGVLQDSVVQGFAVLEHRDKYRDNWRDGRHEARRQGMQNGGRLTEVDLHLFNEGTHFRLFDKLGAHPVGSGTVFAVWAPNARSVSVVGDFNGWDPGASPLRPRASSGVWEGFLDGVTAGAKYKYHLVARDHPYTTERADPLAFFAETPPATASVVWTTDYEWRDREWMATRAARNALKAPISIYEVHLGSWRRVPEEGGRSLGYREMAPWLIHHVRRMGFTHVEFLPVMEHPFFGSWGYQTTGYFAPTSRHGTPQDLMYLIDELHQAGIGVILDWVPSHFPTDGHGLAYFDGTHLYEHADPKEGFHPDWKSSIFNYGRNEVRCFLISSALFWLEKYHADGLRVDAVASMLYRDYSRQEGEWVPNRYGGRENVEAIDFLRRLNEEVFRHHPGVQTYAEESTAWPMVSRPTYVGGLGFGFKWDMGWMHDTLHYLARDPVHRKYHHNELTFRMLYAFTENYVLALSHDEVVHGKRSLLDKMPGDVWQKFANLRLLYGYQFGQPGKKLLFMGGEFGQWNEWHHEASLDWHLGGGGLHAGLEAWLRDLNALYRDQPALHEWDCDARGFRWLDASDGDSSALSFLRCGPEGTRPVAVVCNFTPVVRRNYRIGVPSGGYWRELLNSDAPAYGGSWQGNFGGVESAPIPYHGLPASISLTLPPLAVLFLQQS